MEGVTIIETSVLEGLIGTVKNMEQTVVTIAAQLQDARKPYLSAKEVMEITGFSSKWLNENKHEIGCSKIGSQLRFKRKDLEEFMNANYYKAVGKLKAIPGRRLKS